MKTSRSRNQRSALSAIDLLFAMAMVALISIIAVAKVSAQARSSSRIACLNNLRQIGIAFRMWANGHQNRFPWQVPPKRGTWEWAETTQTFRHFQIASNELNAPGILVCPDDPGRSQAKSFETAFSNTNLSYLLGLAANQRKPGTIVCADRNLSTNAMKILSGIVEVGDADSVAWAPGIHAGSGNIAVADGSARSLNNTGLRSYFAGPGYLPTRFSIP